MYYLNWKSVTTPPPPLVLHFSDFVAVTPTVVVFKSAVIILIIKCVVIKMADLVFVRKPVKFSDDNVTPISFANRLQ